MLVNLLPEKRTQALLANKIHISLPRVVLLRHSSSLVQQHRVVCKCSSGEARGGEHHHLSGTQLLAQVGEKEPFLGLGHAISGGGEEHKRLALHMAQRAADMKCF